VTVAPIGDGTIAYTAGRPGAWCSRRSSARPVQAWPDWSVGAYIRVGNVAGKVVQRIDDTTLLLDEQVNFGDDMPAGTEYRLYRDTYLLPADFIGERPGPLRDGLRLAGVRPSERVADPRAVRLQRGEPDRLHDHGGFPLSPAGSCSASRPLPSDEARTIDYIYHRSPRPLVLARPTRGPSRCVERRDDRDGGRHGVHAAMVGSVIRLSATSTPRPA
jgi:hypothetical protein